MSTYRRSWKYVQTRYILTRVTRRVSLVEQERLTFSGRLSSSAGFLWDWCGSIFCFMCTFCRSLFVLVVSFLLAIVLSVLLLMAIVLSVLFLLAIVLSVLLLLAIVLSVLLLLAIVLSVLLLLAIVLCVLLLLVIVLSVFFNLRILIYPFGIFKIFLKVCLLKLDNYVILRNKI